MKFIKKALPILILTSSTYADSIEALGDEFDSSVTQPQWSRLNDTEGWNADQLELWDFNPSYATGNMVMAPHSSAWYMALRGVLVYKEITGNFVVTMRMRVNRRGVGGILPNDPAFVAQTGAPNRQFSLAGIFLRNPRNITQAAPNPVPAGSPIWPPPAAEQPGHYTTDWTPNGENYIFLSYGSAGSQGTWQYEVKTTTNDNSNLYFNNHGVPAIDDEAQYVTLQMVRIDDTIVTLRKHDTEPWIVENRYTSSPSSPYQQLPNFGNTLQLGVTTYTDWNSVGSFYNGGNHASQYEHNYTVFNGPGNNPDLIAFVDYFRIQRPDSSLNEASLLALPITFTASPLGGTAAELLPATGAGEHLGDNADIPTPELGTDPDGDGIPSLIEIIMGTDPTVVDAMGIPTSMTATDFQFSFPHQNNLDAVTLEIEYSTTLTDGNWNTIATRIPGAGWNVDPPHQVNETATSIDFTTPINNNLGFYRMRAALP